MRSTPATLRVHQVLQHFVEDGQRTAPCLRRAVRFHASLAAWDKSKDALDLGGDSRDAFHSRHCPDCPLSDSGAPGWWPGFAWLVGFAVLQAVVQLAEHFAEKVPDGCGVGVAVFAAGLPGAIASTTADTAFAGCPSPPSRYRFLFPQLDRVSRVPRCPTVDARPGAPVVR